MNTTALIIAVLMLIGVILSMRLDRLVENKVLGFVLRALGILACLFVPILFIGDEQTLYQTGNYLGQLGVAALILWLITKLIRRMMKKK